MPRDVFERRQGCSCRFGHCRRLARVRESSLFQESRRSQEPRSRDLELEQDFPQASHQDATQFVLDKLRELPSMDAMLANHFAGLSTRGKVLAEYIWLGGSGSDLRSATKVLTFKPTSPADVPLWTSDGVATGQEDGPCSVVYLKARSIHPDPLRCFELQGRFPLPQSRLDK